MMKIKPEDYSARTRHVLNHMGISSLEQLANVSPKQILKCRNAGRKTLREIRYILSEENLSLKEDPVSVTPLMKARRTIKNTEARIKLMLLYRHADKLTLREIAEIFGISQERVRQILKYEELTFERHKNNHGERHAAEKR